MGRPRIHESDAARQAAWRNAHPDKVRAARWRARMMSNPDTRGMLMVVGQAVEELRQASELLATRSGSWDARARARDLIDQAAGTLAGWASIS